MIVLIFVLINPLYALVITTIVSIITNRVSNLLIGVLYILSFALLFSNQEYTHLSDLGQYIQQYEKTGRLSISHYFYAFFENPNGREFLWFYYCMVVGVLSGFNLTVFVFTTYAVIFSLFAYLAFLVSERGRYNFALMLFATVVFTLFFLDIGYDLWRTTIAALFLLIGTKRYFSLQSKSISRVLIYSSFFIHISMFVLILFFELYVFLMKNDERHVSISPLRFAKLILAIIIPICTILFFETMLITEIMSNKDISLYSSINKYLNLNNSGADFHIKAYIRPLYIMLMAYVIYNWKKFNHFDLFILSSFLLLEILLYIPISLSIIFSRASIATNISIVFISFKILKRYNYKYVVAFVCLVFSLRMYIFLNDSNLFFLEYLNRGEFLNPFQGLWLIVYSYNPLFSGFNLLV
jgi:hypothetical protein